MPISSASPRSFRLVRLAAIPLSAALLLLPLVFHNSPSTQALAFSKGDRLAGATVFHEKGCEHCHGVDGVGSERGPDLSGVGKQRKKPQIEKQIREGGNGMPPFGDVLQPDEVKHLVDFLAAKKKPTRPLPQTPATSAAASKSED